MAEVDRAAEAGSAIREAVKKVVVIRDERNLDLLLVALMTGGHVLLDDVPGVGKTLLARTFARALGLQFKRIQFTPDLLPSDVSGINFFNQKTSDFEFRPGPVFTNILLADEINRATPRTQSSLLECMQEGTVSVDGVTHRISTPFLVIATQNPVEMEGTFPLPEAQLDRFLMCLRLGYPEAEGEREVVSRFLNDDPLDQVEAVVDPGEIKALASPPSRVHVSRAVVDYIVAIARQSRDLEGIRLGVSPRGVLHLARAAQALACIRGRPYVIPDDVQDVVVPVLGHRIVADVESSLYGVAREDLIEKALERVEVPIGGFEGD